MNRIDDEDRELKEMLEETAGDEIPAVAEMRLKKRLEAFRTSLHERDAASGTGPSWFGSILKPRIATLSALATVAVVVGAILFVLVGDRRAGIAFGDVMEQVRSVRTAVYKFTVEIDMTSLPEAMRPMANLTYHIMYSDPGIMRMTMEATPSVSGVANIDNEPEKTFGTAVTILNYERGEILSLIGSTKQAVRARFNPDNAHQTEMSIVGFEQLRNLRSGSEWELGWKEIEGRPAEGFRMHKDGLEWTVWADPETNFPIIVEIGGEVAGQKINGVMSEFTFDEPLDPSLFSLEIPEGYTELEMPQQIDVSEPDEEDLINGLQWLIESGMDVFPPDLDLATLMSLIQKAGSGSSGSSDQTFEETMAKTLEITSKIVRMQQFVQGKQNVNAWNYSPDVRVGDESAPLCWWRGESGDDYRVVFGDLSARNLGEEELNRMKSAQSEPGVEVPSVQ